MERNSDELRILVTEIIKEEYKKQSNIDIEESMYKVETDGDYVHININSENPYVGYDFYGIIDSIKERLIDALKKEPMILKDSRFVFDWYILNFKRKK